MSYIKSCLILLVAIQRSILGLSPTDEYLETFQYFMLQSYNEYLSFHNVVVHT